MSEAVIVELSEIAFVVYSILIIIMLEIYKEEYLEVQENFTVTKRIPVLPIKSVGNYSVSPPPKEATPQVAPPKYGFLPRNIWKQAYYGGQSASPIPGTNLTEPIENSYSQTTTLVLANPFIREEACLPIEGNIGSKIDIATELFGPFERSFIL